LGEGRSTFLLERRYLQNLHNLNQFFVHA